jgi:hypothetical protein
MTSFIAIDNTDGFINFIFNNLIVLAFIQE